MEGELCNATLIWRQDLTPQVGIVRIAPDSGTAPHFVPGQFCTLGLPRELPIAPAPQLGQLSGQVDELADALTVGPASTAITLVKAAPATSDPAAADPPAPRRLIRRAYSIASSPLVRDYLEFFVVMVQGGKLTPRLWPLGAGERLWMDDKAAGHFTLEHLPRDKNVIMVSTGTGLGPFMSMLRTPGYLLGTSVEKPRRRCVLINGVREAADLGYREELIKLAQIDPDFIYLPIVSREPADSTWIGLRGRVQTVLEPDTFTHLTGGLKLDRANCEVFLCGNPAMIQDVEALLAARGFVTATRPGSTGHAEIRPRTGHGGNVHFERYW